jgi:hypothetical protein
MSEESVNETIRDFFDVRYALPGWVFIIFSLLWNRQIANILLGNLLSILGIFVAGVPIGYILSQIWYSLFYIKNNKDHLKLLDNYNVKIDLLTRRTVCDYIFNKYVDKEIKLPIIRRWTLINMLGSSVISLTVATLFGWLSAAYVMPKESPSYYFSLWIFGLILLILLIKGYVNILQEYEKMNVIAINSVLNDTFKEYSIQKVIRKSGYLNNNEVEKCYLKRIISNLFNKLNIVREKNCRGYRLHELVLIIFYILIPWIVSFLLNKNGYLDYS